MSDQIKVNFEAVYGRIANLRARIEKEVLAESDEQYRRIGGLLQEVDGATNAAFIIASECNRQKTETTAVTLLKLLQFIENATREVQAGDIDLSRQIGEEA